MERGTRIELVTLAWKARVIPFYEPRIGSGPGNRTPICGFGDRCNAIIPEVQSGAGYRVRTDDILVGNETFYH